MVADAALRSLLMSVLEPVRSDPFEPSQPRGATPLPRLARPDLAEACGWSLVWVGVLSVGVALWWDWWSSPWVAVLAPALALAGIAGIAASWLARTTRARLFQAAGLCTTVCAVATQQAVQIHDRVRYLTDSAAFDQTAAHLLLHGRNPYASSMSSAARLLADPRGMWTYTATGGHVVQFSYPAGSFLIDLPGLVLGFHHLVVDWTDLALWLLTGVLLFALLQRTVRWLAPLVLLLPIFASGFSSGGTDVALLPFLAMAVWRWDLFDVEGAGMARWSGPVFLGLACSFKQLAWFCVPFLLVGIVIEARRDGRRPGATAARYLALVAGTFAVLNAPFFLWDPGAWVRGTLTPLTQPLVANGQGLVTLALHGVTGGANLRLLTLASFFALAAVVAAFALWYGHLKRIWPALVPVSFFFATRSLSTYLVDLFVVLVVAAVSVRPPPPTPAPSPLRRSAVLGAVSVSVAVVVSAALAFTSVPLHLAVVAVQPGADSSVRAVTISVHNDSGAPVVPHYMVLIGRDSNGFWLPAPGLDDVIGADSSATLTIYAPRGTAHPEAGTHWLGQAYTSSPLVVATTSPQTWKR